MSNTLSMVLKTICLAFKRKAIWESDFNLVPSSKSKLPIFIVTETPSGNSASQKLTQSIPDAPVKINFSTRYSCVSEFFVKFGSVPPSETIIITERPSSSSR